MLQEGYLFILHPTNRDELWIVGADVHPDDFKERLIAVPGFTAGYEIVYATPVVDSLAAARELEQALAPYRTSAKRPVFACAAEDAIRLCRQVANGFQPSGSNPAGR